ncbi:MAG: ATP-binding cassette domain-containing protein, partial [Candidatus Aenigmatarchaeota archaeon]
MSVTRDKSESKNERDTILNLKNVTKIYSERNKEIRAVDGVTLSVRRGEIFCLLGPNGAGKTTTFRMMSTLE